jgi:N-acyl-L-homoserine lactone synthetase
MQRRSAIVITVLFRPGFHAGELFLMMTGTTKFSFQSGRPAGVGTAAAFDTIGAPDHWLEGRQIDLDPRLMEESHRLRYQVYCIERGFLNPDDYPDQCERDEFDRHSLHLGVVDAAGMLLATARLVKVNIAGLPLFRHCQIYRGESELYQETTRVAEISRLCISRALRKRRVGSASVAIQLYRAIYQASKRNGFTHWLVATEPSLQRLLASLRVPFREVGPRTDYYGPVAPYLVDLSKWDEVIVSRSLPVLHSFLDGLEPEFNPAARVVLM